MKSRELVKRAIAHEETPRVPFCIHLTQEAKELLRDHLGGVKVGEFIDNDVIRVPMPWWGWHELQDDWSLPDVPHSMARTRGHGSFDDFYDSLKRLRDRSDGYILMTVYGSHFEKANAARGIENSLADMAGEPEFARRLLTRIVDKNMTYLEDLLAATEIDGVLLGSDWGTQRGLMMSPTVWDEMIRPGEQREYDLIKAHGRDVWIHSCGNIEALIPTLIEMGVDVLNPIQPEAMDISKLKAEYGDRLTFWGGVSTQQVLPYGTPDEVRCETRRVRDVMSRNGGYILAPSQAIQADVPVENMIALIETAKEGTSATAAG